MGNQAVSLPDEGQQSQMTGKQTGVFAGPSNQSQSEEDWTQSNKHPASLCGELGSQSQSKIMADGKQPAVAEAKNNPEVSQGDEANKNRRRVFIKTPSRNQVYTITVNGEQVAVPWDRDIVEYDWVYEDEADPDDIAADNLQDLLAREEANWEASFHLIPQRFLRINSNGHCETIIPLQWSKRWFIL